MSGLTPQEDAVMQLRDQGLVPRQIAFELGISPDRAARIVAMYDGRSDQSRHNAMMARGSRMLLKALASQ